MDCQDDDRDPGDLRCRPDEGGGLRPLADRHADIHHDQVRTQVPGQAKDFEAVAGLADYLQIGLGVDQTNQAFAEKLMIIDQ